MPLALLFDVGHIVRSTLAENYRTGEGRCLEDSTLAAVALNHGALWTPFVDSSEWHLLELVMLFEVLDDLHYWPPLLSPPTGDSSSRLFAVKLLVKLF